MPATPSAGGTSLLQEVAFDWTILCNLLTEVAAVTQLLVLPCKMADAAAAVSPANVAYCSALLVVKLFSLNTPCAA
jgi:hypothetical protein